MTWTVRSPADLGRALAGVRSASGLTQAQLAELAALDRSYLARIESGAGVLQVERTLRALRRMGAEVTVSFESSDGDD